MVDQTAAPTLRGRPSIARIMLGVFKRPAHGAQGEDPYKGAVEKARAELAETARTALPATSRKLLKNGLFDWSGV